MSTAVILVIALVAMAVGDVTLLRALARRRRRSAESPTDAHRKGPEEPR
jgi:hypothetical protein